MARGVMVQFLKFRVVAGKIVSYLNKPEYLITHPLRQWRSRGCCVLGLGQSREG